MKLRLLLSILFFQISVIGFCNEGDSIEDKYIGYFLVEIYEKYKSKIHSMAEIKSLCSSTHRSSCIIEKIFDNHFEAAAYTWFASDLDRREAGTSDKLSTISTASTVGDLIYELSSENEDIEELIDHLLNYLLFMNGSNESTAVAALLLLDQHNVSGEKIETFYMSLCGGDFSCMVSILKEVNVGLISKDQFKDMLASGEETIYYDEESESSTDEDDKIDQVIIRMNKTGLLMYGTIVVE